MKYNNKLANLIEQFMSQGDQWRAIYEIELLKYVYENIVEYYEDGERVEYFYDGLLALHTVKKFGPRPSYIDRHRRKIKADHNKRVAKEGVGIFWDEDTKELEEETKQSFV